MKTSISIFGIFLILASCNSGIKENQDLVTSENSVEASAVALRTTKGYELLSQKCYMCHLERPDPTKTDAMLAPPMMRVQEHYKPRYSEKDEFVEAVMNIVKNPSEENTLMPGAIKKFNLMPRLIYEDADLKLIVETIYDYDFGSAPKMNMELMAAAGFELDNGKKWKLEPESVTQMNAIIEKVNSFNSDNIEDYNQLGVDLFDQAKIVMLNDSYTNKKFDQIHLFFNGIEGNMHLLMAIQSMDEAKAQVVELKQKLSEFNNYFE